MSDELYTLEQLSERVADLLAEDYDGQRSGRVRELPNGRTIRWYTTIGLVDRPLATRGRVALYGQRHALQLAAIKKLQANGLALAEVQERLVGASDDELAELAELPKVSRPVVDIVYPSAAIQAEVSPSLLAGVAADTAIHAVRNLVPAFRVGDSVTVLLNGVTRTLDDAEIEELTAAATPLLDALERLGLTPRKERR
ncbi:helix-turn-helix domain-containing protein [Actinophytocola algeriensis]|uniref:DNA-binding transcriptional MerR regulator n=1 Tax=Actinophytocola algeriensis TaxID=1768010 RepID=A0A7W7Q4G0_9PSEU|nr:MerR family transcriptional regulator [Actinophytocola algeriensis]MBB4906891.1 DNA-binding transcriptional MerR regulator [Actinophytocola algeriensis]MBE1478372.1 DNA-binding transcriptional MerR regulator [Actinophytocola algeriensis]